MKYLLENQAFTESFIQKILTSTKLNDISDKYPNSNVDNKNDMQVGDIINTHFSNIDQMKTYYNTMLNDQVQKYNSTIHFSKKPFENLDQLAARLNGQLEIALQKEDYEEAAKIRDYMQLLNIQPKDNL